MQAISNQGELSSISQVVLDNLPEGVLWLDGNGRIFFVNATAARLLQASKEEILGLRWSQFVPQQGYGGNEHASPLGEPVGISKVLDVQTTGGEKVVLKVSSTAIKFKNQAYACLLITDLLSGEDPNEMLRIISEGTAAVIGGDFFRSLAYHIIISTGIRYAIVTECANVAKTRVRTLVYIEREHFLDNFEYDLSDTPCEIVMKGQNYYCSADLDTIFKKEGF